MTHIRVYVLYNIFKYIHIYTIFYIPTSKYQNLGVLVIVDRITPSCVQPHQLTRLEHRTLNARVTRVYYDYVLTIRV